MSRYILIRRLRGPAFLLLVGFIALMSQAHILSWGHAWPLFLILAGVLALAERAALATEGYPPPYAGAPYQGDPNGPYPGAPYPGVPNPGSTPGAAPTATSTSIVPARPDDFERGSNGGQS
ncbi:MAG TPA: hypothetical protein VGG85_15430 [Terracidiphilus sp.]|jgi:hypothetical protein